MRVAHAAGLALVRRALLTPDEVRRLPSDSQILFRAGAPPIFTRKNSATMPIPSSAACTPLMRRHRAVHHEAASHGRDGSVFRWRAAWGNGDNIPEPQEEGSCRVVLGQNPPEIAYL